MEGIDGVKLHVAFEAEDSSNVQRRSRYSNFCVDSVIFAEGVERSESCCKEEILDFRTRAEMYDQAGETRFEGFEY
jgi:hypothetical protein